MDDLAITPGGLGIDFGEDTQETKELEEQQLKREAALAKLKDTDGYKQLEEMFKQRIEGFRTGRWIENKDKMTDDKLGQAYRVELLVADQMEGILYEIEAAHKAVKDAEK